MIVNGFKDKTIEVRTEDIIKSHEKVVKLLFRDAVDFINKQPTVYAVKVVRCKDCKFSIPINDDEDGYRCTFHERYYDNEKRMLWHSGCFCSFGERRSE